MLTLGSLFDGIGGWQLAAVHAGVKPIWSSEIEKFPLAVTRKRFPDTKQLGDVTKITDVEPVDIVCAGSPCQDLSIAGKREGLAGERSGLFINAINIVRQMRMSTGGRQLRFFIWENVPGAFTSGSERGADFRAVLESIAETDIPMPKDGRWAAAGMVQCPKCEIAWRVLDAQFWGVPQRRKRIFLVADFATADRRAAEVLFVEPCVPRDSAESERAREEIAGGTGKSIGSAGETLTPWDVQSNRIQSVNGKAAALYGGAGQGTHSYPCVACYDMTHADEVMRPVTGDKSNCLNSRMGTGGNQVPVIHDEEKYTVRRLTPIECERLQGLPDGYTDVPLNRKPASDANRYKALGNGMAQPCADYVIQRIVDEVGKT